MRDTQKQKTMAEEQHEARQEVLLFIEWENGTKERQRFAAVETAWLHFRTRKKAEANRRKIEDRKDVRRAFFVGHTKTGKDYGGWLKVKNSWEDNDTELAYEMHAWKFELQRLLDMDTQYL